MNQSSDYTATIAKKLFVVFSGTAAAALVARFLGPEMRAEYAFIQNGAAILVVILNFGLSNYYQTIRRERGPGICASFVAASIKMAALLALVALLLTNVLDPVRHAVFIVACCSLLRLQFQAVSLVENIRGASIATMLGSSVEVCSILLVWWLASTPAVEWVVCGFIAKELTITALSFRAIVSGADQITDESSPGPFSFRNLMKQNSFLVLRDAGLRSIPLFVLILANTALYKADVLIQSALQVDPTQIGVYVIGVLLAEYLWIFSDIFKDVQVSRTARGEAAHGVARAHRSAILLTVVSYLLFILLGPFVVPLVFGVEFSASYNIAIMMLIANICMIPGKILGVYLISTYDVRLYVTSMVAALTINVALNFLLIPYWGIYGSLVANVISYLSVGASVSLIFMSRTGIGLGELLLVNRRDVAGIVTRISKLRGNQPPPPPIG